MLAAGNAAAQGPGVAVEPGQRIGVAALDMAPEQVRAAVGEPDRMEAYAGGQPQRFYYDKQNLQIQFSEPSQHEAGVVEWIETRHPQARDLRGIGMGSASADIEEAYGDDYEQLDRANGDWVMDYAGLGIQFESDAATDRVRAISVLPAEPDEPEAITES